MVDDDAIAELRAEHDDLVDVARRELADAENTLRHAREQYDQSGDDARDALDAARWHYFFSEVAAAGMRLRLNVALDERALQTGTPRALREQSDAYSSWDPTGWTSL